MRVLPYFCLFLLCLPLLMEAQVQKVKGIKNPGSKEQKKCKRFIAFDRKIPIEENYYITARNGYLYLQVTDVKYAQELFKKRTDGFAIDIIQKEQYGCDGPNNLDESWAHNGILMPPLFKKDFKKVLKENGQISIRYRKLPENLDLSKVEYNLIIVHKKWLCEYRKFARIEDGNWALLPTGLYRDSIPEHVGTRFEDLKKVVSFTIPFEKDKASLDSIAFRPVYDTLNLTDYIIREMRINAFASVEGNVQHNTKLQQARAQSIVQALQVYQSENVNSRITSRENWEQFYNEVNNTPFAHLASLPKEEVKRQLNTDKALLKRLQPLLARHRKAEIDISLEKRLTVETNDPAKLKEFFTRRIREENVQEALFVQQAIFRKIKDHKLPESFIHELEIPKSIACSSLLNNHLIFKSEQSITSTEKTLEDFLELEKLIPNRPKIQYNIIALKTRLWTQIRNQRYGYDIDRRLKVLERSELNPALVARLRVNYNIILTSYLFRAKDYKRKNRVLTQVYDHFRKTHLTDKERLGLARYMTYYKRYKEARDILRIRARQESASDDVLFYYLSLVLTNSDGKVNETFLGVLDRAIYRDPERFCSFLQPLSQGGISFQLLDYPELKIRYCDTCSALDGRNGRNDSIVFDR